MINTTVKFPKFCFILRQNKWYQLMQRDSEGDKPVGEPFKGNNVKLPLPANELNSNYYLKKLKCAHGKHEFKA